MKRVESRGRTTALKVYAAVAALLLITVSSGAQENGRAQDSAQRAPERPDIELPPVVFEYEAIDQTEIETALPEGGELELPPIEVDLPEPESFNVEAPQASVDVPAIGTAEGERETPFFSDGMIGIGLNYSILGDISLYRRGSGPDFSIGFSHEGLDGYGSEPSGTGFFHRREEMSGAVALMDDAEGMLRFAGRYSDREIGLQNIPPDASSLLHRFTRGEVQFESSSGAWGTLGAEMHGHAGTRVKAVGSSNPSGSYTSPTQEWYLQGEGEWAKRWERGELAVQPGYTFHRGPGNRNRSAFSGELKGAVYLSGTDFTVSGGLQWWEEKGLMYPWEIEVSGVLGKNFRYTLSGGYEVQQPTYRELWEATPLLDTATEALEPQHGLQAGMDLGFALTERMEMNVESSWGLWENYISLVDISSADGDGIDDGLFTFEQRSMQTADLLLEGSYTLPEGLRFTASWEGQLLSQYDRRRPRALFSLEAEYEERDGRWGGRFNTGWDLTAKQQLPKVGGEARYRLSEGVVVSLTGSDLLAPLLDPGRMWWGDYIEPGMNITLRTEISL